MNLTKELLAISENKVGDFGPGDVVKILTGKYMGKVGTIRYSLHPNHTIHLNDGTVTVEDDTDINGEPTLKLISNTSVKEDTILERKGVTQLEVDDEVEIIDDNDFTGQIGKIVSFGKSKHLVIVNIDGDEQSFQSAHVHKVSDSFYVAFYDHNEERSWIGRISKQLGGKWHEHAFKGKPEARWSQAHDAHLTPEEIIKHVKQEHNRSIEVEGPFESADEAMDYVTHHFGKIQEAVVPGISEDITIDEGELKVGDRVALKHISTSNKSPRGNIKWHGIIKGVTHGIPNHFDIDFDRNGEATIDKSNLVKIIDESVYTNYADWKQAVILSHPVQANKIKFRGKMEGEKTTVIASIPGEDKIFGIWDDVEETGQIISESRWTTKGWSHGVKFLDNPPEYAVFDKNSGKMLSHTSYTTFTGAQKDLDKIFHKSYAEVRLVPADSNEYQKYIKED